jgi:hypothetical protein
MVTPPDDTATMSSSLDALKATGTLVVADIGKLAPAELAAAHSARA